MKKKKIAAALTGTAYLMSSVAMADAQVVSVEQGAKEEYTAVANVEGTFAFDQDELTPADEVFNLFGTAATAACAKPGFALNRAERAEYYVNVGGKVKKNFTISLEKLKEMNKTGNEMVCSCGSSGAAAMARVAGVSVADILSMAELDPTANAVAFKDAEGYGIPMPLKYVLDKEAVLAYEVNGEENKEGLQVWMPATVAKYFTREVVEIEVLSLDEEPAVVEVNPEYRAKVSVVSRFDKPFVLGDAIAVEGYADDCGKAISAVEFSLDNGATWTKHETPGTTGDKWVYWHFETVPAAAGTYKLDVRAIAEDGTVSPLASSVVFTVE
ncbi:MAG: molybdopterin-dependent oxidoreductase [Clostridia bacterium]|nr:molybdopterin-dependent oxidoreductase [Clostridia bacterium]